MSRHNPELLDELQRIIGRSLSHDLQLRYPSTEAVMDDIEPLAQDAQDIEMRSKTLIPPAVTQVALRSGAPDIETTSRLYSDGELRQSTVVSVDLCDFSQLLQFQGQERTQQIVESPLAW